MIAAPATPRLAPVGSSSPPNLAAYEVFRSDERSRAVGAATLIATVDAPATFYTDDDPSLVNVTTYYYAVRP